MTLTLKTIITAILSFFGYSSQFIKIFLGFLKNVIAKIGSSAVPIAASM